MGVWWGWARSSPTYCHSNSLPPLFRAAHTSLQCPHDQILGVEFELIAGGSGLSPRVKARRPLLKRGRVPVEAPVPVLQVLPVILGEQRVEEGVDAAVAVRQTRHQVVDAGVRL